MVEMVNVDSISPYCLFSITNAVGTLYARIMGTFLSDEDHSIACHSGGRYGVF